MTSLVLGPLLRHVDETTATLWVETARSATVTVEAGTRAATARTFAVHDHHYALITVEGLEPGSNTPYVVRIDEETVWPPEDSDLPEPTISTLDHRRPLRLAFGSCRTSVGHDEAGNDLHGVDALRAYALRMAGTTDAGHPDDPEPEELPRWPDLLLLLGDQVYADETTTEMQQFIAARRDITQAPWTELRDYQEYAELYRLAWTAPVNRWLLSTLPSAMIFDDHDVRDDWNTSWAWKQKMEATDWWHGRIVSALASYWVYQHLGNLTPTERDADEIWQQIAGHTGEEEFDATALLDDLADRADQQPDCYRWSYTRDFGDETRLVVIDSRAARVLEDGKRSILDPTELSWLDEQLCGDVEHLFIGTSLPFLLAPGLHYVEAFSEALAGGAWGRRGARWGEWIRQTVDLEHWAAFQDGFQRVAELVLEVARGERGRAPGTITFLSGDVHHSYVSRAHARRRTSRGQRPVQSTISQAVCSPIRNPLPRRMRFATAFLSYGVAGPLGHVLARSAKVREAPLRWKLIHGPWFDNSLATLEVTDRGLAMWWATGTVDDGDHARPRLHRVARVDIDAPTPTADRSPTVAP